MLVLPAVLAAAACSPGGRSDLPVAPVCAPEPAENPDCPSGTGLTDIGPEISENQLISAVHVDGSDVFIIVVETGSSPPSIWRIPNDGDPPIQIPTESDCWPDRLAVNREFVYWSGHGCVRRAYIGGGGEPEVLMGTQGGSLTGITADGTSVFIAGSELDRVEEDGSLVALGVNVMRGDIDTDGSAIYGVGLWPDRPIVAFDLASRQWRRVTVEHVARAMPSLGDEASNIAHDRDNVYWISNNFQSIASAPKHSGGLDRIVADVRNATGVAAADGYVYWAEQGRIRRANCDGSIDMELFRNFDFRMGDLALDETYVYFTTFEFGHRLMRVCR